MLVILALPPRVWASARWCWVPASLGEFDLGQVVVDQADAAQVTAA